MAKKEKTTPQAEKAPPGPRTKAALEAGRAARDALPLRPFLTPEDQGDGTTQLAPPHSDRAGHSAWVMSLLGTTSPSFVQANLDSLNAATSGRGKAKPSDPALGVNAALAMLGAIDPQNELEGALAAQMVGCHNLSMEMLCRASTTDSVDHLKLYGDMAVKMQRTFTAQVEALARLRGKGQQTVRVEHVTVHPGAQAIVGDVHHHPPGASGAKSKSENQSYESASTGGAAEPPALPSPDPAGYGVPIPGDAERALSHPRRTVARRANRKHQRAEARSMEPGDDRDQAGVARNEAAPSQRRKGD